MPASQSPQLLAPVAEDLPDAQASQLLSPVGLCLPATQLLQYLAPVVTAYAPVLELWLAVYFPDPHAEQAILPELVLYRPASQLPQTRFAVSVQADVWPMPAEHVVHAEQSLLPELVLYLPVSQLTQVVAVPSAAVPLSWWPASHAEQSSPSLTHSVPAVPVAIVGVPLRHVQTLAA